MSANITVTNGVANMVSLRVSPWHALGAVVSEEMSDDQVLEFAGMNWDVREEPVYREQQGVYSALPDQKLLVRGDTGLALSVVNRRYRPFQNREMVQLMRSLAAESRGGLVWETAGLIGARGDTAWCQARLPDLQIAMGNDKTEFYWLIRNGHGNALALTLMPTAIRVVCQNTMNAAAGGAEADRARRVSQREAAETSDWSMPRLEQGFSVIHSAGMDHALQQIVRAYARAAAAQETTKEVFERLAAVAVDKDEAAEYWESIFALPSAEDETQRAKTIRENKEAERRRRMDSIWASGTNKGLDTQDTAFSAWQAAVEFIDHEIYAHNPRTRFHSSLTGGGAKLKREAWETAGEMFLAAT